MIHYVCTFAQFKHIIKTFQHFFASITVRGSVGANVEISAETSSIVEKY